MQRPARANQSLKRAELHRPATATDPRESRFAQQLAAICVGYVATEANTHQERATVLLRRNRHILRQQNPRLDPVQGSVTARGCFSWISMAKTGGMEGAGCSLLNWNQWESGRFIGRVHSPSSSAIPMTATLMLIRSAYPTSPTMHMSAYCVYRGGAVATARRTLDTRAPIPPKELEVDSCTVAFGSAECLRGLRLLTVESGRAGACAV